MTSEDLAAGKVLDSAISYYTDVLARLADDDTKEAALVEVLATNNTVVPGFGDAAAITTIRESVIDTVISEITDRLDTKQAEFDALGAAP